MNITTRDGVVHYLPGVYTTTEVVSDLPGPLPEFLVPVIVGDAKQGHPYNGDASKYAHEPAASPFRYIATTKDANTVFGEGSDLAVAFAYAREHGMPFAYCVAINPMTRASAVVKSGTGAVDEITFYAKTHGPVGGWPLVAIGASNALTITPVKRYSTLTANVGIADTRIYVDHNAWIQEGMTLAIGSNSTANIAVVVSGVGSEFNAAGQIVYWVDLAATPGVALTVAGSALLVQYGTQSESSGALANGQAVVDWLNSTSQHVGAVKEATFSNVALDTVSVVPLRSYTAAVVGTAPASSSSDHADLIGALDATEWDRFLIDRARIPQAFLIADPTVAVHAAWRSWAATKRELGEAVSITTGCDWGDIVIDAGDSTDPKYRARLLDSEDVMLVANGADWLAAYLTRAPAVFGMRVGGGVGHNLTNDPFRFAKDETTWDERTQAQLTTLTRAGVVTNRLQAGSGGSRYVVTQGVSTLQANGSAWNTSTNDTPLVMQRDHADYFDRVMSETLDRRSLGGDGVTRDSVAAVLLARSKQLKRSSAIIDYTIGSITINDSANGIDVEHSAQFPLTNDFITMHTRILVGG